MSNHDTDCAPCWWCCCFCEWFLLLCSWTRCSSRSPSPVLLRRTRRPARRPRGRIFDKNKISIVPLSCPEMRWRILLLFLHLLFILLWQQRLIRFLLLFVLWVRKFSGIYQISVEKFLPPGGPVNLSRFLRSTSQDRRLID